MPNFHIASITLYNQDSGLNASAMTSSAIPPATISISTSSNAILSNYSGSPTSGFSTSGNKFSGGGSGGGSSGTRTGHHNKYQQGLNNRPNDLEVIGNINDNNQIDNPMDDLSVISKQDFFT